MTETGKNLPKTVCLGILDIAHYLCDEAYRDNLSVWLDMTPAQQVMLKAVKVMTAEKPDGITLKELAESLSLTPGSTSEVVDTLVRKDALERNPNPNDRRAISIKLSERMEKLSEKGLKKQIEITEECISGMTDDEKSQFLKSIKEIQNKISKRKEISYK